MGIKLALTRGNLGRKDRVCQAEHEGHSKLRGMKSCVQETNKQII